MVRGRLCGGLGLARRSSGIEKIFRRYEYHAGVSQRSTMYHSCQGHSPYDESLVVGLALAPSTREKGILYFAMNVEVVSQLQQAPPPHTAALLHLSASDCAVRPMPIVTYHDDLCFELGSSKQHYTPAWSFLQTCISVGALHVERSSHTVFSERRENVSCHDWTRCLPTSFGNHSCSDSASL